jgi:hypothetical protein
MTLDNDFDENELIRVIKVDEVTIVSLAFNELTKFVILGTNTGIT